MTQDEFRSTGLETAVIGMAGRFPGAPSIHEFWENLKKGIESISFFTDHELIESGVESKLIENPNYVKANSILEGIEYFDSSFFGYTPPEADVMDPQMRVFHECAWHALEEAGYCPENYEGLIGIYAGAAAHSKWELYVHQTGKAEEIGKFSAFQYTNKDFLCPLVAYRLNLRGPAVNVQTACSTSLVAIHMAHQAILNGECDLALAGGVSITNLNEFGYVYQNGMISSPDGHCRAFDAGAQGTIGGDGVGIVVLKRLENALSEGDHIYALVKGSAINNDGFRKVGFSAPSIEGQADVIISAQEMSEVAPDSISYIESHGTGTDLGDPVEIEALKLAFEAVKNGSCAIGTVKTNVGHLNTAAGVTGFIKTVLSLYHHLIPPTLHFVSLNPKIDFEGTPFYVNTSLTHWTNDSYPLRTGVSSFGIGGTNAHVILEEYKCKEQQKEKHLYGNRDYFLILLSARNETALNRVTENLAVHLKENPHLSIADAAYTLQVGRKAFSYRRFCASSTVAEAASILENPDSGKIYTSMVREELKETPVIFMFPGQGVQYTNMARDLYEKETTFRREVNLCFEILKLFVARDLKKILYPNEEYFMNGKLHKATIDTQIQQTEVTQMILFTLEYSLARLLMSWGIQPYAMIGHSIGEYVAACLSGVFSLENALEIVAIRGQLMQQMPEGAMLSVSLPEKELKDRLKGDDELSLAAVNSTSLCVISGPIGAVDTFARQLKEHGCECRTLHTSHAFHSKMMEPLTEVFEKRLAKIVMKPKAEIPYISNVTGTWANVKDAATPRYWARHLRSTVRFADGLEKFQDQDGIFLEVGPGRSLSTFVRQHERRRPEQKVMDIIRHPKEQVSDTCYLVKKVGQLWGWGIGINWPEFYGEERRQRIPLPLYPFEKERFPIARLVSKHSTRDPQKAEDGKNPHIDNWFYVPRWKLSPVSEVRQENRYPCRELNYLIFANEGILADRLKEKLREKNHSVTIVRPGSEFAYSEEDEIIINPRKEADYQELLNKLKWKPGRPSHIIHLWTVNEKEEWDVDYGIILCFYSLIYLVRALEKQGYFDKSHKDMQITVMSNRLQAVTGREWIEPLKALVKGVVQVIPREYPWLLCRSIDIEDAPSLSTRGEHIKSRWMNQLLPTLVEEMEIPATHLETFVAFRNNQRWVQTLEPVTMEMTRNEFPVLLKEKGVYLITGGLGGIGLVLAEFLAKKFQANLILIGRSEFPEKGEWQDWLLSHDPHSDTGMKIQKIQELESRGAEVQIIRADVADEKEMHAAALHIRERFGNINGIIHSAGNPDGGLIHSRTDEMSDSVLSPKVKGLLLLDSIFCNRKGHNTLDFIVLCSSLSSVLSPVGQVAYCAANNFLDSYAVKKAAENSGYTVSINWDSWQKVGMAVKALKKLSSEWDLAPNQESVKENPRKSAGQVNELKDGILPEEGIEVFKRVLALKRRPQFLISTTDLMDRIKQSRIKSAFSLPDEFLKESSIPTHARPDLSTPYVIPSTETERRLVDIWQQFLRIRPVGIHDDFFELGGDSLKVMTISAKIHQEMKVEIPLTEFLNRPTINEMADYIDSADEDTYFPIHVEETKEYYHLSPAQRRLYLLQQMEPASVAYNLFNAVVLKGDISRPRLEEVFRKLICRHESCRTAFITLDGEVFQRVNRTVEFEIGYQGNVKNFVKPFVLETAPLLRVGLVKLVAGEHVFLIDTHHIISDGTSMGIIIREFMAFYEDKGLPELKVQYKDYAQWQSHERKNPIFKAQEEYWLQEFTGEIPVLNLPTDFPRPDVQIFDGHSVHFEITKEESDSLSKIAAEEEASLFVMILSLLNIFLSKITHQHDILIGTQVAGRNHADLQGIVGVFLNTLVLRNFPRKEKNFKDFLNEVKARTWQAFENQEYPFEDLVQNVLGSRTLDRNPFFDVMLVWQNMEIEKIQIPGLELQPYEGGLKPTSLIDLSIYGFDRGENLMFTIEYNTGLFKKETIDRYIKYMKDIVSMVVADQEIKLVDIEVSLDLDKAADGIFMKEDKDFGFW